MVSSAAPADLTLLPVAGEGRTLREWVTNFHLVAVVLDPYTNESSWILPTASRIMAFFREADCRVAWVVAADAADTRTFLGPYADQFLTFCDPDKGLAKAVGLERLPAVVHLGTDLSVVGVAQGWKPAEWRDVFDRLGTIMSWSKPLIPDRGDPKPFEGSAALG